MDTFKLGQKWFWIGILVSVVSPLGGIIYAIALSFEPHRRKESLIIGLAAVIMGALVLSIMPADYSTP